MEQIKITILLVTAILLQWTAGNVWQPLSHIDFVLIAVVYSSLQRNAIKAIFFGAVGGVAIDALSGGLIGSNGFTKTFIAYLVSEISRRFNMDNLFLKLSVLAVACLLDDLIFFGINFLLGRIPTSPFAITLAYNFIATFAVGVSLFFLIEYLSARFGPKGESFPGARRGKKSIELR
jgi:rod shape-determining protein MreD